MPAPASILKQTFGYDTFRPLQQEVIENVMSRRDTLAVMPTGGVQADRIHPWTAAYHSCDCSWQVDLPIFGCAPQLPKTLFETKRLLPPPLTVCFSNVFFAWELE